MVGTGLCRRFVRVPRVRVRVRIQVTDRVGDLVLLGIELGFGYRHPENE